jgi:hypothetical protein
MELKKFPSRIREGKGYLKKLLLSHIYLTSSPLPLFLSPNGRGEEGWS